MKRRKLTNAGFTIVELMIATAVLSTILLLITVIMINIGSLLYKGINQSRIQDSVRSITDQISQDLKLNTGDVQNTFPSAGYQVTVNGMSVPVGAFCIGDSVRYTYVLGYKIGSGTDADKTTPLITHVLWRDDDKSAPSANAPSGGGDSCVPVDLNTVSTANDQNGSEMIATNSRLTRFCVGAFDASGNCSGAPSSIYTIAVGAAYGDIDLLTPINTQPVLCQGSAGDQYCATSNLLTTVQQRLN